MPPLPWALALEKGKSFLAVMWVLGGGVPFTPLVCRYLPLQSVDMATKNLVLVDFFLILFFEESF